jgi:hypothetical protein
MATPTAGTQATSKTTKVTSCEKGAGAPHAGSHEVIDAVHAARTQIEPSRVAAATVVGVSRDVSWHSTLSCVRIRSARWCRNRYPIGCISKITAS